MTTKKQLRILLSAAERRLGATEIDKETAEDKLAEAEKLTDHQRATIRSLTEKLDGAESAVVRLDAKVGKFEQNAECTGCTNIDENGKKLHPQKCACCRRGAKDNYTPMEATEA